MRHGATGWGAREEGQAALCSCFGCSEQDAPHNEEPRGHLLRNSVYRAAHDSYARMHDFQHGQGLHHLQWP